LALNTVLSAQNQYKYSVDAKSDKKLTVSIVRFIKGDKMYRAACKESKMRIKERKAQDKAAKKHTRSIQQKEVQKRMKQNEKKANRNNTGNETIVSWFRKKEYNYRKTKQKQ